MPTALRTKVTGHVLNAEARVGPVAPVSLVDRSRFGNDGAFTNITMVQLPSGLWVMSFNGATSVVNCGVDSSLDAMVDALSLEAWVNFSVATHHMGIIEKNHAYDEGWGLTSTDPAGIIRMERWGLADDTTADSTKAVNNGEWHHLLGSYDGTYSKVYINGIEDGSQTKTVAGVEPVNRPCYVGWRADANHFEGYIALPRIYNYVLTPGQIRARFDATKHWFGVN